MLQRAGVPDPSILVVHPDRKTQRIVQRILGVTGFRVDIADDVTAALAFARAHAPILIVMDGDSVLAPGADAFFAATRGVEACMTLLAGTHAQQVPKILGTGAVTNLLVHPMPVLAEELTVTAQKLIRRDLFGAEKYLLWGTELHAITVRRGSQRSELVGRIAEHVRAIGQSARVASAAMLVTDELVSNAVHNAPIDSRGAHYRRDSARDVEIELDPRHEVRVRWGCDARYLAIEVRDQFGSLDRETILGSLCRTEVREAGGGAGMGVSLTYRSCDHLVFNLAPGRQTEVIALIDVRAAASERGPASSYNIFVEKRGEEQSR